MHIILYEKLKYALKRNPIKRKYSLSCRPTLVERMPVLDEVTFIARRAGSFPGAGLTSTGSSVGLSNGVAKPVAPIVDLLDMNSDDAPAPSSSGGDFLQDLLGVDLSLASQQSG